MDYRQEGYRSNYPARESSRRPVARPYGHATVSTQKPVRSSQDRRLSDARKLFLADETAKPILRSPYEEDHPTSKALYYGTLSNQSFNNIYSPDQTEFLTEQAELDRRSKSLWGGGIKQRVNPLSFWAGDWLRNNAFTYPRVQRHGRKLRLLERKKILDRLTASEKNELVKWWESKFGPIETPPTSPIATKQNIFTRTLAHVRGTRYYKARQAKRRAQEREEEKERNMTSRQRMDRNLYGGNPNGRLDYLRPRSGSGGRILY